MAIALNDITSGYNLAKINANFQNIEDYINDKLLARAVTGVAGEAMMERSLDMNGNKILNIFVDVDDPDSLLTVGVADSRYYNVSGDTLTGPMNVNSQAITGLPSPTISSQAVNKAFVDAVSDTVNANNSRALRFPETIPQMTSVAGRADSLQGYNNLGAPVPIFSYTATADLALKLASSNEALGAALVNTYTNETVQSFVKKYNGKILISKLDPASSADQTALMQAEVNSLTSGMIYITPTGTIRITTVVIPTLSNMHFIFSGTVFKLPDGYNPLDSDMIRFNRLTDSFVDGLSLDGNRDNLAINGSDPSVPYGRVIGWRIGNSSARLFFRNVSMVNMLYCGSQWGRDIQDITIDGCFYDNIGEHVFYISGKGGGNVSRVTWRRVRGGSHGINTNNTVQSHACAFIKSAQSDADGNPTIGDNDFFEVDGMTAAQTTAPGYASVIVINGYLRHLKLKDVRVGGSISGVISPLDVCWYVDIDGLDASSDTVGCPVVFTYPSSALEIRRWTARNVNLPGAFTQINAQLFDKWEDCILSRATFSEDQALTSFAAGKRTEFIRCKFTSTAASTLLQYVRRDVLFNECIFSSTFGGANAAVDYIGQNGYTAGALVSFTNCKFANSGSYSIGCFNDLTQLNVTDCWGGLKQIFCRSSTGLAKLRMNNVEMSVGGSPPVVASSIAIKYVSNVSDISGARDYALYKNTWTIATGQTTISFDLTNVLVGNVVASNIQVSPRSLLNGATKFYSSVSGNTVSITVDTAVTAATTFNIQVVA